MQLSVIMNIVRQIYGGRFATYIVHVQQLYKRDTGGLGVCSLPSPLMESVLQVNGVRFDLATA